MARVQFDPTPANSTDLAALVNEHAKALDLLSVPGGTVPGVPYADITVVGALNGGDPFEVLITVADHATQNLDFTIPVKAELGDAFVKKIAAAAGANANTVQVQTAAGAVNVTDAMSINNAARGAIVRAAVFVDDAPNSAVFAAGATVRVAQVKAGGDAAFRLHLRFMPRA